MASGKGGSQERGATASTRARGDRVCIDLNGVLDTYDGWRGQVTWHPPRPGAQSFLKALAGRGLEVTVLTTRDREAAWQWLTEHHLARYVSEVIGGKPPALAYIDDRGLCFRGDFQQALRELDDFAPHWQRRGKREGT